MSTQNSQSKEVKDEPALPFISPSAGEAGTIVTVAIKGLNSLKLNSRTKKQVVLVVLVNGTEVPSLTTDHLNTRKILLWIPPFAPGIVLIAVVEKQEKKTKDKDKTLVTFVFTILPPPAVGQSTSIFTISFPPLQSQLLPLLPPPTITSISPGAALLDPGLPSTTVTVTGTGFVAGATVTIANSTVVVVVPANSVTFVSSTEITFVVPPNLVEGTYSITVTNPTTNTGSGGSGTLFDAFTSLSVCSLLMPVLKQFAILANEGIDNTGTTTINRNPGENDIGVWPGDIIGSGIVTSGTEHKSDSVAEAAQAQATILYNTLSAFTPTVSVLDGDLTGTLVPGVYRIPTDAIVESNSILTLDAQGNAGARFIFQITGNLDVGINSAVVLTNGAQSCNVFWRVTGNVGIGRSPSAAGLGFTGTIVARGVIELDALARVDGRLFSLNSGVLLNSDSIVGGVCTSCP